MNSLTRSVGAASQSIHPVEKTQSTIRKRINALFGFVNVCEALISHLTCYLAQIYKSNFGKQNNYWNK